VRAIARGGVAPLAGMTGALAIGVGALLAALAYRGSEGQAYSPLNHWISELGELSVAQLAPLFNLGLIVGGSCFVVFVIGLALARGGWLRWAYAPIGVLAGASGVGVGIFPMDFPDPHILAALGFFNLGWIFVGLASLDIWRRPGPRFPRWLALIGAVTVVLFLAFLSIYLPYVAGGPAGVPLERAALRPVTVLQWGVLVGIIGWVLVTSLTWLRARSERPAEARLEAPLADPRIVADG
jgi:hypothetical membrane protein